MEKIATTQTINELAENGWAKNERLELVELFSDLWRGKWLILAFTLVMGVAGYTFSLTAGDKWSTKAIVTQPQLKDYSGYRDHVKQYQPIFDVYQGDGTVKVSEELNSLIEPDEIFKEFRSEFNSTANKKAFLDQDEHFVSKKNEIKSGEHQSIQLQQLYYDWFKRLTITELVKKRSNGPYILSAEASSGQDSYQLLSRYVDFVNKEVGKNLVNNLKAVINNKHHELKQYKEILIAQAKNRIEIEKERAKIALKMANAAGVSKPLENIANNDVFNFNLGSDALNAKIKVLDEIENYSIIEPMLQQIEAKISLMSKINVNKTVELKAYRYQKEPALPTQHNGPSKSIVIVIFALIGALFGVVFVLIQSALKKRT